MAHRERRAAAVPGPGQRRRIGESGGWVGALTALTAILGPAVARAAIFKSAPNAAEDGGGADGPDTILGLIHINTAFFIAIGVIALYWFLFGGGRKPKVGRKE